MKNFVKLIAVVAVIAGTLSCSSQTGQKAKLKTTNDTASYMIGMSVGTSIKSLPSKDDINPSIIAAGIQDILNDGDTLFSMEEMQLFLRSWQMKQNEIASEKAKNEGTKFLEENKTKEGVIETESGLQYRVIKEGNGAKPVPTDKVKVHYTGRLVNGTVFDSSVERGKPAEFQLNQVIPGWTEGLQLMTVGSTYELYIPYQIGYGERGAGQSIPPYATLIFEVELLDILAAE